MWMPSAELVVFIDRVLFTVWLLALIPGALILLLVALFNTRR